MKYIDKIALAVRDELKPEDRPAEHGKALYELYALLVLTRGHETSLADVHDAWSVWMGRINPEHEALVPFGTLSRLKQDEDQPFRDAIRRVAADPTLASLVHRASAHDTSR